MYVLLAIYAICITAWIYLFSNQLSKKIKEKNGKDMRKQIFIRSAILSIVISLGIHFSFIYMFEMKIIVVPDWLFSIETALCFILIPVVMPRIVAHRNL